MNPKLYLVASCLSLSLLTGCAGSPIRSCLSTSPKLSWPGCMAPLIPTLQDSIDYVSGSASYVLGDPGEANEPESPADE